LLFFLVLIGRLALLNNPSEPKCSIQGKNDQNTMRFAKRFLRFAQTGFLCSAAAPLALPARN
jgi:hypothetical protein